MAFKRSGVRTPSAPLTGNQGGTAESPSSLNDEGDFCFLETGSCDHEYQQQAV